MQKQQPPQDPKNKHSCNETADAGPEGAEVEVTDKATAKFKEAAEAAAKFKEAAEAAVKDKEAAAAESEAADKVIAAEGNDLLERLQEISRLQYRAIMGFHVYHMSMSRICVELRITPDRLQIEIAAGFKTLFHLAIEDDFMGYFTKQAEQHAQQLAKVEAKEAKKTKAAAKK